MFWIGIIIGSAVTFIVMALCKTAGMADEHAEKMYKTMHRGDKNGNDQD